MNTHKSKIAMLITAIACVGCCAIPLYSIVVGASSIGVISTLISDKNREVLICLLPLLLIAIDYYIYRRLNRKSCCTSPTDECGNTQCASKNNTP